jgi:hypothetical protein
MRKPTVPPSGQKAPLTKLKDFVRTNAAARDELFALTDEMNSKDWLILVNSRFSFGLSLEPALVTRFREYVGYLQSIDAQNDRLETIREVYAQQFPAETDEQLDARAITHFKRDAVATGDQEAYVEIKSLQLMEQTARTKASQKERDLNISDRRVKVLEQNAARALEIIAEAKKTNAGGLTPETLEKIERELKLL